MAAEPFDQHDADIRSAVARILKNHTEKTMHKGLSEATRLLEQALTEWQPDCPGAGWEHHNTQALVTLAIQPSMRELLRLASIGAGAEQGEVAELKHVADRIYDSNPLADEVRENYRRAMTAEDGP
jgi:hypothetical protein